MAEMKIQTAIKDHYCDLCSRKIPNGHRYWREDIPVGPSKEHTNCVEYEQEDVKPSRR